MTILSLAAAHNQTRPDDRFPPKADGADGSRTLALIHLMLVQSVVQRWPGHLNDCATMS